MITLITRTTTGQTFRSQQYFGGDDQRLIFNNVVFNDLGAESSDVGNLGLYPYTFPNQGIQVTFSGTYFITGGISVPSVIGGIQPNPTTPGSVYQFGLQIYDSTQQYFYDVAVQQIQPRTGGINAPTTLVTMVNAAGTVRLFKGDIITAFFVQNNINIVENVKANVTSGVYGGPGIVLSNLASYFDAWLSATLIVS